MPSRLPEAPTVARAFDAVSTAAEPAEPATTETENWAQDTRTLSPLAEGGAPCLRDARVEAAARVLASESAGVPDADELVLALRREGSPYVWPRLFRVVGGTHEGVVGETDEASGRALAAWLAAESNAGTRCGVARATNALGEAVTVGLLVEASAELAPLPLGTHVGRWLTVEGTLAETLREPVVVVLGPRGATRRLPTTSDGARFRATFAAAEPGRWVIQLLAADAGGPRPVLEAWVFAGVLPSATAAMPSAPGERSAASESARTPADALAAMVLAARASQGVSALKRNDELDRLAREHAEAMRALGRATHDTGQGAADARVRARGVAFASLGENVAKARDLVSAHRVLWASPAHRSALVEPRYTEFGVGVAREGDRVVYVCELFLATR